MHPPLGFGHSALFSLFLLENALYSFSESCFLLAFLQLLSAAPGCWDVNRHLLCPRQKSQLKKGNR
ncbi:MAG: hypothetical protein DMF76_07125 [Acidobacteria bacterium]|nr:MAG: hypothetical protein DMF76_07125 [Acidobacteriota bacterium]